MVGLILFLPLRWYRAPELLFGARYYDMSVDMWAVGAIIGELYNLNPLFASTTDINQIFRILQVLGTPTQENWPVRWHEVVGFDFRFPWFEVDGCCAFSPW